MNTTTARAKLPLSLPIATGLAVLSGLLYFVAFPGIDVWPLSLVALAPLVVALRGQSPKRGFWLGWLTGFVAMMLGLYWIVGMLRIFSGFPTIACVFFTALLCGYQGGRLALAGWLATRVESRGWWPSIGFGAAFVTSELVFPLLFPWYYGACVHNAPLLLQSAELGGPMLVALVLTAPNIAVGELALAWLARAPVPRRLVASLIAVPLVASAIGWLQIRRIDRLVARASKARVGLVQANMSLFGKRQNLREGLERHLRLTRQLKQSGPLDLVVWSETSVMRAIEEPDVETAVPRTISRHLGVPAIIGAVIVRQVSDERKYVLFNSAISTDQQGKVTGRYDKQFLLAFGEYLPFGEMFPVLYQWSPNSGHFAKGKSLAPLNVAGHPIATFICYEDLLPGFINDMLRQQNSHLLVNMTNDAWFGDSTEPYLHLALAKLRAVEQRRFLVRSTNSGVSAFVDPVGRNLSETRTFVEAADAQTIAWLDGTTPFRLLGQLPMYLLALLTGAAAFRQRRAPKVAGP